MTINLNWLGLLQVVLIVLKLMGYITLGWWLVFLPAIALTVITAGILLVAFALYVFVKG